MCYLLYFDFKSYFLFKFPLILSQFQKYFIIEIFMFIILLLHLLINFHLKMKQPCILSLFLKNWNFILFEKQMRQHYFDFFVCLLVQLSCCFSIIMCSFLIPFLESLHFILFLQFLLCFLKTNLVYFLHICYQMFLQFINDQQPADINPIFLLMYLIFK